MNRDKHAFFTAVQRMEKESKERREDPDYNKRILLKGMSNGFGRNVKNRKAKVTLPKLSIQEDKE